MKVFVLDDEPVVLFFISFILIKEGFTVEYKRPPLNDSFYSDLDKFKPDVILLDIYLEDDLRGDDVARNIRERTSLKETPIVAISSSELIEDKMRIFSSGFVDLLNKPLTKGKLINCVSKHAKINELICMCKKVISR